MSIPKMKVVVPPQNDPVNVGSPDMVGHFKASASAEDDFKLSIAGMEADKKGNEIRNENHSVGQIMNDQLGEVLASSHLNQYGMVAETAKIRKEQEKNRKAMHTAVKDAQAQLDALTAEIDRLQADIGRLENEIEDNNKEIDKLTQMKDMISKFQDGTATPEIGEDGEFVNDELQTKADEYERTHGGFDKNDPKAMDDFYIWMQLQYSDDVDFLRKENKKKGEEIKTKTDEILTRRDKIKDLKERQQGLDPESPEAKKFTQKIHALEKQVRQDKTEARETGREQLDLQENENVENNDEFQEMDGVFEFLDAPEEPVEEMNHNESEIEGFMKNIEVVKDLPEAERAAREQELVEGLSEKTAGFLSHDETVKHLFKEEKVEPAEAQVLRVQNNSLGPQTSLPTLS